MTDPLPDLAIVGGTGELGAGLARRLARADYPLAGGCVARARVKSWTRNT